MPENMDAIRAKFNEKVEAAREQKAIKLQKHRDDLDRLFETMIDQIKEGVYEIAGEGNTSPYIVVKTDKLNEDDSDVIATRLQEYGFPNVSYTEGNEDDGDHGRFYYTAFLLRW
jgi:hypothetical protein